MALRSVHAIDCPEWDPPAARRPVHRPNPAMDDAEAELLWLLCREAGEPFAYESGLSSREARARIAALSETIALRLIPRHTD